MTLSRRFLFAGLLLPLALVGCGQDGPAGTGRGGLTVAISGLPAGTDASVMITGPEGFNRLVTRTETFSDVKPGLYTVKAAGLTVGNANYAPVQDSTSVRVSGQSTPSDVEVRYVNLASSLRVQITGLPAQSTGNVTVTGPGDYRQVLNGSSLLAGLSPGTYSVSAAGVMAGDSTYQWRAVSQEIAVSAGGPSTAEVTYASVGVRTLNLSIDRAYLVQVVQNHFGTVPLIASRDALLRVFVKADQNNTATPTVRVRFYNGGSLQHTLTAVAPLSSVPLTLSQASLHNSWNVVVPAALIRPGLSVLVDVDPGNAVVEANETDNQFPSAGTPLQLDVRDVPLFQIRFIPVHQASTGLTGVISEGQKHTFMEVARKIYPFSSYDADVRAPYTTTAPALDSDNGNGSWSIILSEIDALRVAEGTSRYYYGVVKLPYQGGIAGIGQIPGKAALGYDRMPKAPEVVAHELGHDFGRRHAPCGQAGGSDPEYPYPLGQIGVFGFDMSTGTVRPPTATDIMGYCDNVWIGDFTYTGILNHRKRSDRVAGAVQPSLMVWGRIQDGQMVLEPAFQVTTRPVIPSSSSGPYRIEGFGASGAVLFSHTFAGEQIPGVAGDQRTFAFAIPLPPQRAAQLATLRLTGQGRQVQHRSVTQGGTGRGPVQLQEIVSAQRVGDRGVSLQWNGGTYPVAMVRDAQTGEILSFARGGAASLRVDARELEVTLSDGVRNTVQRVRVPGN